MSASSIHQPNHRGSCLCGAVTFWVGIPLPAGDICHCRQCRKWSGHLFASIDVPREHFHLENATQLRWYSSSDKVRRGFCGQCGSSLFWDPLQRGKMAIALGAFDGATQAEIAHHIFVAEKGDYYSITDSIAQQP